MDLIEKTLSKKTVYDGNIFSVTNEEVALPNGEHALREIVLHKGGVGIIPITYDNKIVMVKQFRNGVKNITLEIPAGKLENNEDVLICAKRELKEETGYTAGEITKVITMYASPAYVSETDYLFVAKDLVKGESAPDNDEFVEILEIPIETLKEMLFKNEIKDSKTIIAILIADKYKY